MLKPHPFVPSGISRRQFLYYSALAASAVALPGCVAARPRRISPNDKLNLGVVGVSGKGSSDMNCCASENIVALCDVDEKAAAGPREKYPKARFYKDFRKMLETGEVAGRGGRLHAGPSPRDHCQHGDPDGQTRLLPEAADADDL